MVELNFKKSSIYTRESIGEICYPGVGRPKGGDWDTGYVRVEAYNRDKFVWPPEKNNLIVFMNIGVPGRTGHDFDNYFDQKTNTITWFGKPNKNSKQNTFTNLLNGKLIPHFFARWDSTKPEFIYLGIGSIVNFEDGVQTKQGKTIKLTVTCLNSKDIIDQVLPPDIKTINSDDAIILPESSFVMEKHLEDFIYNNWYSTPFGDKYKIYENGRQFPTNTGPLDILALRNDQREFLVLELKRDKATDIAVAQTLRYMGYIKTNIATNNEHVRGCIVATHEDQGMKNALSVVENIDFYQYNINFSLNKLK